MSLSVLLLCDDSRSHAPNVLEHVQALRRFSRHRIDSFNPVGIDRSRLLRLDAYDAVVVHYTVFVLYDDHLSPWFREQLAGFDGLKAQFIQDEYRQVDAMTARMRELGIGVVFSSVPADAVPDVYGDRLPGVEVLPTLTGYVPAELVGRPRPPLAGRPLDVVYRGRSIPYWLGRLGQDKVTIGREFLERAAATGLRCDIAWTEADRIYGDAWYEFLRSSRATLGTESGASIVDFDGSLQQRTESYLREHPTAGFDEVERELLAPYEGNAVIEAISPRVFEAAALGTAMVNFAGRYSDAIEPWTHYVPLEKDFSNFDKVVAAIQDEEALDAMAGRAHEDLVASGRYSLERFVADFDDELAARATPALHRPRPRFGPALQGRLLALEQLRSPERRAQLPLVASARAHATERTNQHLVERFPAVQALAKGADDRLLRDLVRLAAASAAHLRELSYFGPPFDVRLELGAEERRLTLVGTTERAQDAAERTELRDRVAATIRDGRLEEIVWDNSAVECYLLFPSLPVSSLDIGYHVINGAHRFTALAELAQRDPDAALAALEPLFRPRPDAPVHELDRRKATLLRTVLRPGSTAARGTATVRAVATSKELRRLLRAYLGSSEARAEAPLDLVLKDFLRLRLVGESGAGLELDDERKTLVYRTGTGDGASLDTATVQALERIVWADSAVLDGVYDFEALAPVARRFPDLAVPALERAARGG